MSAPLIEPIPLLRDNYAWLIRAGEQAVVVDPSEGESVRERLANEGLSLAAVLITHPHWDHVEGVPDLRQHFPDAPVICSRDDLGRIAGATEGVDDGAVLSLLGLEVRVLSVPGHTLHAVAYHWPTLDVVFTGDTLFTAGCGRLFEGTPAMMLASLERLMGLPQRTRVYCGHEYTEKNLRFAMQVEPNNEAVAKRLAEVRERRAAGEPTVPERLAVELETNPFLRVHLDGFSSYGSTPSERLAELRRRRDEF